MQNPADRRFAAAIQLFATINNCPIIDDIRRIIKCEIIRIYNYLATDWIARNFAADMMDHLMADHIISIDLDLLQCVFPLIGSDGADLYYSKCIYYLSHDYMYCILEPREFVREICDFANEYSSEMCNCCDIMTYTFK